MLNNLRIGTLASLAILAGAATAPALAGPLGLYGATIDKNSPACLNYGDAVSCSAPLLNYLAGKNPTTTVANGGYVLPTPQGALDSYIVITAGGGAQGNGDTTPAPAAVENGFKSNDAGSADFLATGKANGITVVAGNLNDPTNNSLAAGADRPGTWDVGLNWLLDALTINGVRRELMIGFDYNQPQNSSSSLDFWSLITLRDLDGGKADINFEIANKPGANYATFSTDKTYASMPASTDFGTVNGVTCVDSSNVLPIKPIPGGQCPVGYDVAINNAQSTANTEIFAFLPELNANLSSYLNAGYDVASVRLLMGCFGGTAGGSFKPGIGYLSDEAAGGRTTNCDSGGFGDVYLLAGAPMELQQVPEPATLTLLGAALAALGATRRRRGRTA